MNPYFTTEEKVQYLKKLGFDVKLEKREMSYPCYHNDVEVFKTEVWAVYKNDTEYRRPGGYNFKKEDWLDTVFNMEMNEKLKIILLYHEF